MQPVELNMLHLLLLCSYVWEHLEMGYVQGMCDLLAPLMVILDDGEKSFRSLFHYTVTQ